MMYISGTPSIARCYIFQSILGIFKSHDYKDSACLTSQNFGCTLHCTDNYTVIVISIYLGTRLISPMLMLSCRQLNLYFYYWSNTVLNYPNVKGSHVRVYRQLETHWQETHWQYYPILGINMTHEQGTNGKSHPLWNRGSQVLLFEVPREGTKISLYLDWAVCSMQCACRLGR